MSEATNPAIRNELSEAVPQTYGEAVAEYGEAVISCEPHEWDNRTTQENAQYLLGRIAAKYTSMGRKRKRNETTDLQHALG